ncbi:hypothetical protein [Plantactinospora sp. BB1]|uniref:hypothetical protein n=1 Tax=Plantactinospora sp. BB1 TaxID=2071627 RepID=UPI000D167337|nr:hypothetical protein [Plantactinospora sp. BB1]AVT38262.1 hypothetical protein C6W10_19480 [Plantactinospora sp. BB1]
MTSRAATDAAASDATPTTTTDRGTPTRPTTVSGPAAVAELARVADLASVAGRVRDAVLAVPGVSGLTAGTGVEVATLFPGGKIVGIRLGNPVEVHVEVAPVPIAPVAEQIQRAVRAVLADFGQRPSVEVVVDDIDLPVPVDGS